MKKKRNELVNCGLFEEHCRIEMIEGHCKGNGEGAAMICIPRHKSIPYC